MPDYLKDFELLVSEKIDQEKLDEALNLIVRFVQNILHDQRATAKVFGSSTLDGLCQKIGAKTLLAQNDFGQSQLEFDDQLIIYIATELYMTGGHTAVLEDFIKFQPDKKHLILMTDLFGTGETEAVKNRFDTDIVFATGETYLDKLYWLQLQLTVHKPSQIFLFNHHQDAVAISSVQPILTSQLIFYHHCDHNMSLGLYLSHAKHIDPHSFGYYNCRNKLGVKNNIYIPLVAEDLQPRSSNTDFVANKKLTTCSSGSANKFEQPYSYIYAEEVPKILAITDGYHIHIGSLSPQTLVTIQRKLGDLGINPEKFIHIPWVKSIWRAMSDHNVDLYISSFPIGGGRASIEVMGSGTPIIGCRNYHSRLLSVVDIIYPEAFFWDNPEELYNYLDSLTQVTLFNQANFSRKHYERYHMPKTFQKCLEGLRSDSQIIEPTPLKEYFQDKLKAFLDDVTPYKLELELLQSELQNTQYELERSQNIVASMQTSKFWKLRDTWFKLKRIFGATQNSTTYNTPRKEHKTFAFISGCPGDPYRYRCKHQAEMLVIMGYSVEVYQPNVFPYEELLNTYKVVVAHRVAYTRDFGRFISNANKLGIKVVFDIDDLIFDLSKVKQIDAYRRTNEAGKKNYEDGVSLYRKSLSLCKYIVVSTDKLRQEVQTQFPDKKVIVSRNRVSEEMAQLATTAQERASVDDKKLRIAYFSGTKTHAKDFDVCVPSLCIILKEFHHVHLMIVGHLDLPEVLHEFIPQIETISFVKWQDLPDLYRKVSINLAPLEFNNDFTESKSELKYFEAALLHVPTIASNLGAFCVAIKDNINGRLCTTPLEWENAMRELIIDPDKRKELGQKAFEDVNSRYLTKVAASKTVEILKHLIEEDLPPK